MPQQQFYFLKSRTSPTDSHTSFIVRTVFWHCTHFFPNSVFNITLPIFRSTPALEVGMPVFFAISLFTCVMPNARFHEKLRPGMGDDFFPIAILFQILYYVWNSSNKRFIRILSNLPIAVMLVLLSSSQSWNSKYFPF